MLLVVQVLLVVLILTLPIPALSTSTSHSSLAQVGNPSLGSQRHRLAKALGIGRALAQVLGIPEQLEQKVVQLSKFHHLPGGQ